MRKPNKQKTLEKIQKEELKKSEVSINYFEMSLAILPEISSYFRGLTLDKDFYYATLEKTLIEPIIAINNEVMEQLEMTKTEIKEKKIKLIKKSELFINFKANLFAKYHKEIIDKDINSLHDKYFLNITKITSYYAYLRELIDSIVRNGEKFSKLTQLKWLCWRIERFLKIELSYV